VFGIGSEAHIPKPVYGAPQVKISLFGESPASWHDKGNIQKNPVSASAEVGFWCFLTGKCRRKYEPKNDDSKNATKDILHD